MLWVTANPVFARSVEARWLHAVSINKWIRKGWITTAEVVCTSWSAPANVLGNMPGKNLRTNGSKTSANGTMTKTRNGTRRKRSAVVRTSCRNKTSINCKQVSLLPHKMHKCKWSPLLAGSLMVRSVEGGCSSPIPWCLSWQWVYSSPQWHSITWTVDHVSHHVFCRLHPRPKNVNAWLATHLATPEEEKAELA